MLIGAFTPNVGCSERKMKIIEEVKTFIKPLNICFQMEEGRDFLFQRMSTLQSMSQMWKTGIYICDNSS